jgi:putative polyketide hydroxylase
MNTTAQHPSYDDTTPVLIAGGGLVGLSTALFLAGHGIASLLVERHPGTAIHPRAAGITPRTMEMFRSVGIEEAIHRAEPPIPLAGETLLVESLTGEVFDSYLEDIGDLFKTEASPAQGSGIAQDVLEPVLRARTEQLGGDLRFNTELIDFEQDGDGVTATIRERANGNTRIVHARYLVVADGSQSAIRRQIGIGTHGPGSQFHCVSIIFEADLMGLFRQRNAMMCFLSNDMISGGALVPYPGSAARSDLFRLDVTYDPEEETLADYPEARCMALIRAAIGIPDFTARIKTVMTYEAVALVANRFQQGRIFLVGDAARTQPPSGGLGGNTGIAEAYNLTWKLAAVLHGEASEKLLATYDEERRPLGDYTSEQSALLSHQRQNEGSAGITVDLVTLNAGYRYPDGAFVHEPGDNQLPLAQRPERWAGQPGTHAPHMMLERTSHPISTLDLFGSHFVLLAGPQGQIWEAAARRVQDNLNLPLDVYQIGGEAGDLADAGNTFCAAYGITPTGAVLVRPDGFIGWRCHAASEDAQTALTQAISAILCRAGG